MEIKFTDNPKPEYFRQEFSLFNNQFHLIAEFNNFGRMSHQVNGFEITELSTGKKLMDFIYSEFDLAKFHEKEDVLEIHFRIYPDGSKTHQSVINLFKEKFYHENQEFELSEFRAYYKELLDSSFKII